MAGEAGTQSALHSQEIHDVILPTGDVRCPILSCLREMRLKSLELGPPKTIPSQIPWGRVILTAIEAL
jgi:hypothetical protein